jgi:glycosyltransferase involved in cell wall biosynthesis
MGKKHKICLVTPAQPSVNPRLVKEADALSEAGYEVQVLCAHYIPWAHEADKVLLASRKWCCTYVGGTPARYCLPYWWTRLRHGVLKKAVSRNIKLPWVLRRVPARVSPELMRVAKATRADLYIAHNLAALPPAVAAARKNRAKVGFDAEDFHSGMGESEQTTVLIESIERQYLPQCDYLTAGSPQIAEAYAAKYQVSAPIPILNVFPLAERPSNFRAAMPNTPLRLYWFSQTIGAKRGLDDVVQAIGLLPECDIELHLRGDWQADYQNQLFALVKSCGIDKDKIKGYNPAPADEMTCLAAAYDVGLALEPGKDENNKIALSNKVFTYLLAGNAVIATATKSQQALMETIGKTGFCYAPGEVQMLAAQLKRWHDDREALEQARRAAWECGTACYNWDVEKHKFLAIVKNTLECSEQK